MLVAGLCGGHDANWCFFDNGKLIGAYEKERFTRIRHDGGRIIELLEESLIMLGYKLTDIDLIATTEHVHAGLESGLQLVNSNTYTRIDEWVEQSALIGGKKVPVISVPHHLCHASYSYYTGNESEMSVITWDGGGDFYTINAYTSTSISVWRNGKLDFIDRIGNCDIGSLWYIYSQLIFKNGNAAGKLMGLAAKGNNTLVEDLVKYCKRPTRGPLKDTYGIKNCWPDEDMPPFNMYNDWKMQRACDLAYAIEAITKEVGVELAGALYNMTKNSVLGLAGGVALNGYMNTAISNRTKFKKVHIPPSVHDGGLSIGAVLFVLNHILSQKTDVISETELVFTGINYSREDCLSAFEGKNLKVEECGIEECVSYAVEDICQGKIIAWFEGRAEHGPRALGHRSIISHPKFSEMKDRLNSKIKFREPFRPIAPVLREEDIKFCTDDVAKSPYMMHIVDTKEDFASKCPSAVHLDGTARVQTVRDDNSMGLMLKEMKRRDEVPVILNTSFNVNSPIVERPSEAIETFMSVPIDTLYINGFKIKKQ